VVVEIPVEKIVEKEVIKEVIKEVTVEASGNIPPEILNKQSLPLFGISDAIEILTTNKGTQIKINPMLNGGLVDAIKATAYQYAKG